MSIGNPNYTNQMIDRRSLLLKKLKETTPENYDKTLAMFAIEAGMSERSTREYFKLFKKAGLI